MHVCSETVAAPQSILRYFIETYLRKYSHIWFLEKTLGKILAKRNQQENDCWKLCRIHRTSASNLDEKNKEISWPDDYEGALSTSSFGYWRQKTRT